ncbi:MAG: hypothetical protein WBB24_01870 [Maribacter sp.]
MKTKVVLIFLSLFIACNENPKKAQISKPDTVQVLSKQVEANTMKSGDYSTLLANYTCDMKIAEVAKVLDVPESDLRISDNVRENACSFDLKGFSENNIREETQILWGPFPSTKKQNKKEIASYLERKEEGIKIRGMDIQLADTGDCYLAYLPSGGSIIIYNENYDNAFRLSYGTKNTYLRTPEIHQELRLKMTDLAKYLLKKHRK